MKKRAYILMFVLIMIFTNGCSGKTLLKENEDLKEQVSKLEKENNILELEVDKLNKQIEELMLSEDEDDTKDVELEKFEIYGADVNTYEREVVSTIEIDKSLSVDEKVNLLSKELSKKQFDGLGIELLEIKDIDGKEVAVINLTENENSQNSWKTNFFQGSTGGILTTTSLLDTFLQKEYSGEWIDGVWFLYNNEDIKFDHVEGLSSINYRDR